ncbi:hypothetical protein QAD02_012228 [Eretmocerus hayati]|uniref:Uncharacterized protein n=1 Tax=Eretmocerus hayati TaxID=131215 RepID=A0ACC2P047_9HYME|nr:hypothetical protein QAD02_012228 [Eretmocerus hayati]
MDSTYVVILLAAVALCKSDVSHLSYNGEFADPTTTTTQGPPNPYSFQYTAGRIPGTIDRVQTETGDGLGHVQGSYSYVDPKLKVRTVEYIVNENGFQPSLINYDDVLKQPVDSEAVRLEKERHRILYQKIAASNAQGAPIQTPKDSASVEKAKARHYSLYQKIAAEHAAIAAEREAARLAFEATSVANEVNEPVTYFN